ncbi:conserved hypothetical protein [Ricinus communis]|uniref:Uncharacterized protein n=1 Tax=Ricinus communis TaxID=3988 RepID=B9S560_RICCO|nr:conserved hypothetical protein [Ricinus communis]
MSPCKLRYIEHRKNTLKKSDSCSQWWTFELVSGIAGIKVDLVIHHGGSILRANQTNMLEVKRRNKAKKQKIESHSTKQPSRSGVLDSAELIKKFSIRKNSKGKGVANSTVDAKGKGVDTYMSSFDMFRMQRPCLDAFFTSSPNFFCATKEMVRSSIQLVYINAPVNRERQHSSQPSRTEKGNAGEGCKDSIIIMFPILWTINENPRHLYGGYKNKGQSNNGKAEKSISKASKSSQISTTVSLILTRDYLDATFKGRGLQWNGTPAISLSQLQAKRNNRSSNLTDKPI